MKKFVFVLCSVLSLMTFSCRKHSGEPGGGGDEPHIDPTEFKASLEITPGQRLLNKVVSLPKVVVKLACEDDMAEFNFVYSVDGGEQHTARRLYDGVSKDISADFRNCSEYGSYSLKGYVVSATNASMKQVIDTLVWMVYVPVEEVSFSYVTLSGNEPFTDEITVYEGEYGNFDVSYLPAATFLPMGVKAEDKEVFFIDETSATNSDGHFKVSFRGGKIGSTKVTFLFENGLDVVEHEAVVNVIEDKDGKAVTVDLSCSGLVMPGVGLSVVVDGYSGQSERLFDIEYLVDGVPVKSTAGMKFNGPLNERLDVSGVAVGTHVLTANVSSSDGRMIPISKECSFVSAVPKLVFDARDGKAAAEAGDGGSLTLMVGSTYGVSVSGVPEAYMGRFSVSGCSYDNFVSAWELRFGRYGRGNIVLSYSYGNESSQVVKVDVLRTDVMELALRFNYVKTDNVDDMKIDRITRFDYTVDLCDLSFEFVRGNYPSLPLLVSGSITYYGSCNYLKALSYDKEGDFVNSEEVALTDSDSKAFRLDNRTFGAEQVLIDLQNEASAYSQMNIRSKFWPLPLDAWYYEHPQEAERVLLTGIFPYELKPAAVVLNISSSNDEGLTYQVTRNILLSGVVCSTECSNVVFK